MVGRPAAEYYNIEDDFILEVDLTPNRIDAASHYGVARDIAAALTGRGIAAVKANLPLAEELVLSDAEGGVTVSVEDADGVTLYCGVTIEGVKIGPSPEWLADRLKVIGLHPINNVVDITNYVLHAIGQPLHAFDANRLSGNRIVVRRAEQGSKFTTLDGVERTLDAADLMICDATEPKTMAGVFGGLDAGVTDTTTRVFLESACFNSTSVRRTARRHGISTDSSFRFERGVDPNGCEYAMRYAAGLICSLAGGKIVGPVTDFYPNPVAPYPVEMQYGDFSRLIGAEFSHETIDTILDALEIEHRCDGENLLLGVPTYRVDVRRPCDVIEDFLRIYDYNKIPMDSRLHATLSYKTTVDAADDLRRTVSDMLSSAGWARFSTTRLQPEAYYAEPSELAVKNCVRLLNPLSNDLCVMRQTLLYGGLETIAHNTNRRSPDAAVYEFGNVYFLDPAKAHTQESPLAPYTEKSRLGLWMAGKTRTGNWLRKEEEASFYDLRAAVNAILVRCGIADAVYAVENCPADSMFSQALAVTTVNGKLLGHVGVVAAEPLRRTDCKNSVYYAELDWAAIAHIAAGRNTLYAPLPKTQPVIRDLSLLIDKAVTMADIEAVVRAADKRILRSVELFDVYEGDKLPAGKKSYAITITLRTMKKTLQDKYIERVMGKIINDLTHKLGAELR